MNRILFEHLSAPSPSAGSGPILPCKTCLRACFRTFSVRAGDPPLVGLISFASRSSFFFSFWSF